MKQILKTQIAGVVVSCLVTLAASARTIVVHPGESIQSAVDSAKPGDTVEVLPGTYREAGRPCPQNAEISCAVVISIDNVTLRAKSSPLASVELQNSGGQDTGIIVAKSNVNLSTCLTDFSQRIEGSTVEGFTVTNFEEDGVVLFCVDNFTVSMNSARGNPDYGIFPLFCTHGRVTGNSASGSNDTGLYIGESNSVRVDHNSAFDNVSGFEIENSYNIQLDHNTSYQNTGGVLMFIIPGLNSLVGHDNQIQDNIVVDNNRPNTCKAGDDVCLIPSGTGILSVAGSSDVIRRNIVLRNETGGIGLLDACTAFQLTADECSNIGYDPLPELTEIKSNLVLGNGTGSQSTMFPGSDLLWTGVGNGNCWTANVAQLLVPSILPPCE